MVASVLVQCGMNTAAWVIEGYLPHFTGNRDWSLRRSILDSRYKEAS